MGTDRTAPLVVAGRPRIAAAHHFGALAAVSHNRHQQARGDSGHESAPHAVLPGAATPLLMRLC